MASTPDAPRQMRWFGHPLIVAGLLGFLALDFLSIASGRTHRSVVQRAVLGEPTIRSSMHGRPLSGSLCRTDQGLEWIWSWDERYEDIAYDRLDGYEDLHATVFLDLVRYEGVYHITHRVDQLFFSLWRNVMAPEEWSEARAVIAAAIDADDTGQVVYGRSRDLLGMPPALLQPDRQEFIRRTPLSTGYVRNGVSITALALAIGAFIFGRTWLWPGWLNGRRRWRCSRGLCPACGYDLSGLDGGPCPECGAGHFPGARASSPRSAEGRSASASERVGD